MTNPPIATDWRHRPYPEPTPISPDVSAAACAARAARQDRRWRRVKRVIGGLWWYSAQAFTRAEALLLLVVYLLNRILDTQRRQASAGH
jgi:hypothetical protein